MSANIVSVDEESLRKDTKNLVRKTVEETLNALLDEEASACRDRALRGRRAGRPTAAATTPESSSPGPGRSSLVHGDARRARGNVPRGTRCQRCTVHLYRNVPGGVP